MKSQRAGCFTINYARRVDNECSSNKQKGKTTEGTFLNRYEQQYEKETVEDVRISRISKQGFAEMEANKQKKADQEPVELVNADGVHVTAQSNGTNSAAAYFAKNYSNCMNQKTTEPED